MLPDTFFALERQLKPVLTATLGGAQDNRVGPPIWTGCFDGWGEMYASQVYLVSETVSRDDYYTAPARNLHPVCTARTAGDDGEMLLILFFSVYLY